MERSKWRNIFKRNGHTKDPDGGRSSGLSRKPQPVEGPEQPALGTDSGVKTTSGNILNSDSLDSGLSHKLELAKDPKQVTLETDSRPAASGNNSDRDSELPRKPELVESAEQPAPGTKSGTEAVNDSLVTKLSANDENKGGNAFHNTGNSIALQAGVIEG
ncbi:hypothetical protein TWF481_006333 [Arthrobotrys musiformis]|uniref:Uncharacterized protein n=1 Tax=Arthrobotrys musiformis TaxID=47236 RepID=A0AAV9WGG0_9PEZI